MRSKELSMQVKEAILKMRKQKKPIREIATILGVAKSTVWYILRKKESTGELSNAKRPGRLWKTTVVDDRRIISMVKRNPFTTANQVKNTLQETNGVSPRGNLLCMIKVTRRCLRALDMWRRPWFLSQGPMLGAPCRRVMLATDVSLTGWGMVMSGHPARSLWSGQHPAWHFSCLEMLAVFQALLGKSVVHRILRCPSLLSALGRSACQPCRCSRAQWSPASPHLSLPPGNVAELGSSPPLRGSLQQLVRLSPAGRPLQDTELAAQTTPEASLERLVPLVDYLAAWKLLPNVTAWVLRTVERGYLNQFSAPPPFNGVFPTVVSPEQGLVMEQEVGTLLRKEAIKVVPPQDRESGFYSRYFIVPKKDGDLRPILDLRLLNRSVMRLKFKMLTVNQALSQIRSEDWFVTIDLKDAYFHVSILPQHRKFLRFAFRGEAYQYRVLPFGLALSPRTFTKCVDAALAPLRLRGICILNCINDWLILAQSEHMAVQHRDVVLAHMKELGLRLNAKKKNHLSRHCVGFNHDAGTFVTCLDRVDLTAVTRVKEGRSLTVKQFQRLLGLMAAASNCMFLGKHGSRHPVEAGAEARGMDASPRGGEADLESFWPGSGGPLRYSGECTNSPLVLSDSSSSPGAGCHGTDVAKASSEGASGRGPSSFSSPVLAVLSMVRGPDFPPRRLSQAGGTILHPRPELWKASSTRKLYALKWKLFTSWCGDHQQDPVNCPVGTVLEFLQDRFSAGLAHSTLKVYVAAIAAYHTLLGSPSVGRNPLVTGFLHGALRLRPLTSMAFSSGVPSLTFQRCGLFHASHFHKILGLIYATLGSFFLSS
ncbi:Transposon Ty3-I Gag-Pol polyprotein [Labeo rohita]|uniref:ribonuclease H n=1 Tax=Labeo rohita TaxID=84645 RepID=A0ABQ8LZ21_LABRO|nr:Transposon Ty3-I Gag-Pol polyprotein [Labeo rohita]